MPRTSNTGLASIQTNQNACSFIASLISSQPSSSELLAIADPSFVSRAGGKAEYTSLVDSLLHMSGHDALDLLAIRQKLASMYGLSDHYLEQTEFQMNSFHRASAFHNKHIILELGLQKERKIKLSMVEASGYYYKNSEWHPLYELSHIQSVLRSNVKSSHKVQLEQSLVDYIPERYRKSITAQKLVVLYLASVDKTSEIQRTGLSIADEVLYEMNAESLVDLWASKTYENVRKSLEQLRPLKEESDQVEDKIDDLQDSIRTQASLEHSFMSFDSLAQPFQAMRTQRKIRSLEDKRDIFLSEIWNLRNIQGDFDELISYNEEGFFRITGHGYATRQELANSFVYELEDPDVKHLMSLNKLSFMPTNEFKDKEGVTASRILLLEEAISIQKKQLEQSYTDSPFADQEDNDSIIDTKKKLVLELGEELSQLYKERDYLRSFGQRINGYYKLEDSPVKILSLLKANIRRRNSFHTNLFGIKPVRV